MAKFSESCFNESTKDLLEEIKKIVVAKKHKPFNPQSELHKKFLTQHLDKAKILQQEHAYLNLSNEINYFQENKKTEDYLD